MKYYSVIRGHEYEMLKKIKLDGSILDVGGSRHSGYHELIQGEHSFHVINIDRKCSPDTIVDVEKKFPFNDESFEQAISLNVLEHVYEFENVLSETVRCVKKDGKIIIATPFIHHIHASPDDYFRYTDSAFRRMALKHRCKIEKIEPLGFGFFSLGFQCVGGAVPTTLLQASLKWLAVRFDKVLNKISSKYRKLTSVLPLGYFVVMVKE
jgi:SAM-dependent methyltransferase